jgi:hypothetical protein
MTKEEEKELTYKNSKIIAYKLEDKSISCFIYRDGSNWQPLNLGECNNGSKFTAVNQAINQAKQYIDFFNK